MNTAEIEIIDVTVIEPKRKHPYIFEKFDALHPGEAMCILNDHDPKPLYYQLLAERGNVFEWAYLENGPENWRVEIRRRAETAAGETVGEISASDIRKADVFKKYGIDFCCGGRKSLEQACREKNLDPAVLKEELDALDREMPAGNTAYAEWDSDVLIDHILQKHHAYVKTQMPVLQETAEKLFRVHGIKHPELQMITRLLHTMAEELSAHMHKEELVLFPYIRKLNASILTGEPFSRPAFDSVETPIRIMEMEHESAGDILAEVRSLCSDYTLPEDGCGTYRYFYSSMAEFEEDLKIHIHLENNILFPRATEMEKELTGNA